MRRVFLSYHHKNDQYYKDELLRQNDLSSIFIDRSVRDGDIDENLPTQKIREKIRDNWLKDSSVTILLCGKETKYRKHVDWELKSSMIDGAVNKKSGILVILLPSIGSSYWKAAFGQLEKQLVYPECLGGWETIETKAAYEQRYPDLPERIVDNLWNESVRISIVPWDRISNHPKRLSWLIDQTANSRTSNNYDLMRPMKMRNYTP